MHLSLLRILRSVHDVRHSDRHPRVLRRRGGVPTLQPAVPAAQFFKDSWSCACLEHLLGFFAVVWWATAATVATGKALQGP